MKIISKYKDYYDYLQGAYGIDDKVVLDRRTNSQPLISPYKPSEHGKYSLLTFYICDRVYYVVLDYDGVCYSGNDLKLTGAVWDEKFGSITIPGQFSFAGIPLKTDLNIKLGCPIVLVKHCAWNKGFYDPKSYWFYPKLEPFKLIKELPAVEIYTNLYTWIERNKVVAAQDDRTDIQKLEADGFDKKASFRNM